MVTLDVPAWMKNTPQAAAKRAAPTPVARRHPAEPLRLPNPPAPVPRAAPTPPRRAIPPQRQVAPPSRTEKLLAEVASKLDTLIALNQPVAAPDEDDAPDHGPEIIALLSRLEVVNKAQLAAQSAPRVPVRDAQGKIVRSEIEQ